MRSLRRTLISDPFLYAVILTFITVIAALIWTPSGPAAIIDAWYQGIWDILAFALQMALILGHRRIRHQRTLWATA
jgi:short-chain fatty acids transporter